MCRPRAIAAWCGGVRSTVPHVSKRNLIWLAAVVVVGVVVAIAAGVLWGLLAAAITLAASEVIERTRRRRRRAEHGGQVSPLRDAIGTRRRR